MSTKTIALTGTEVRAEIAGGNVWLRNDGADTVYAAKSAGVAAGANGVVSVPAGQSAPIYGANGTVYLLGTGSVQLIGSDYSTNPFKTSAQSGGSGADEVARAAITAHAGSADIHVTAAEKAEWDAMLPFIGMADDLFSVKQTCVCTWNSGTLNTPYKAGLTSAGGGLCIVNNASGSAYTSYLVITSGGTAVFSASSNKGAIRGSWVELGSGNASSVGGYTVGTNGKKGVLILPADNGTLEVGQRIDFHSAADQDFALRLYVSPENWDGSASAQPRLAVAVPGGKSAYINDGGNAASVGVYTEAKIAALEARIAALEAN